MRARDVSFVKTAAAQALPLEVGVPAAAAATLPLSVFRALLLEGDLEGGYFFVHLQCGMPQVTVPRSLERKPLFVLSLLKRVSSGRCVPFC